MESIEPHVGGNGGNTSRALGTIGANVRVLGSLGKDQHGSFVLQKLIESGVDTNAILIGDEPTAISVAIVNSAGNRKFLQRIGINANAFAEPVRFTQELTDGMAHFHLCSLFILPKLRSHARQMLIDAKAAGLTTSFDTNWDPQGRWLLDVEPLLPHLDYLFMNEDEMRMVTGSSQPETAADFMLKRGVRTVVLKLGAAGCAIFTGTQQFRCPGLTVKAVDSTGAGDCFVAGFLDALLRGASLPEAGRFANAVGAHNVQSLGALGSVRHRTEIERWMLEAKPGLEFDHTS